MQWDTLIERLGQRLKGPLPGPQAQMRMSPRPVNVDRFQIKPRPDARKGGVLVLFYPNEKQAFLPLIVRQEYDGVHSGQVGFPGGKHEEGDADLVHTAVREAEEEIGVDSREIQVLGQLSRLYIPPSNFSVQPVVAISHSTPRFLADSREVAKVLTIPFAEFLDEKKQKEEFWERKGLSMITPFFHIQDHVIWGATAMMMSELIHLVKEK